MKRFQWLLWLPLLLTFSGCVVVSVFPFYQESDLVVVPELGGKWVAVKEDKDKETWEFKKWGEKGWWLQSVDAGGNQTFAAAVHSFRLKDVLFLDMAVAESEGTADQIIRPHFLFKVTQTTPTLKWSLLSEEFVKQQLEKDPKAISHQSYKQEDGSPAEDLILTGDTKALQGFLLKHLQDTNAFSEVDEMRRLKP